LKMRSDLRELRGNRSLSAIAKNVNITPQMLGKIERGERTPSLSVAKRIALYYGVLVDEIFFVENRDISSLKEFPKIKVS
jgi:putative transcriptional regulator